MSKSFEVPPYSKYAAIYDRLGQRAFGEGIARASLRWLADRGLSPQSVLDLACGTGAATLVFAQAGLIACGVDRSEQMLRAAGETSSDATSRVSWVQADIRSFETSSRFDLITCFYDAVNYLTEPGDFEQFLSTAAAALSEDGYLFFDVLTEAQFLGYGFRSVSIVVEAPDLFCLHRYWYDPSTKHSPLILTCFYRDEGLSAEAWQRFDEAHIERPFSLQEIEAGLQGAGLRLIECHHYDEHLAQFGGPARNDSERLVVIAQRTAGSE
jgi:SAM-dependent methyltransferase